MKTLYRYPLLIIFCFCLFSGMQLKAQIINDLLQTATNVISKSSLSNDEIVKGLKEALNVGTNNSVASASKTDGFLKNAAIKIVFPSDARDMETQLRNIGMGEQCDKFVETLNRGAEEASKSAATIFINAVTNMTISDGIKLLNGGDNAATQYLKDNTSSQLKSAFTPIVKAALAKVKLTEYWNPLASTYNKLPFVKKVNPDLDAYVTDKTIDGLFKLIANEEYKIRKDPAARVSDILKKVFGAK